MLRYPGLQSTAGVDDENMGYTAISVIEQEVDVPFEFFFPGRTQHFSFGMFLLEETDHAFSDAMGWFFPASGCVSQQSSGQRVGAFPVSHCRTGVEVGSRLHQNRLSFLKPAEGNVLRFGEANDKDIGSLADGGVAEKLQHTLC